MTDFPAASKFAGNLFQQGISDSHSLFEFSECGAFSPHNSLATSVYEEH